MIFLILTEMYNACKCVPLNLDHSKTEFFITFISYPHTKLIINYHFCKIQSGHPYSSPAMIFLILTEMYNACKCVPLNLDHSKTEFFITFIFLPHTKLIINYNFCKIQSGHPYSSPAMIFLILTETYNACKCVPLNLDHSKTEFFITFISYPHTKLIINYHFCKIQSGHSYSSPAMISFNITRNVQCLQLCEAGFKIEKLFLFKAKSIHLSTVHFTYMFICMH